MKIIDVSNVFSELMLKSKEITLFKHNAVFMHGAEADSFYIVLEGSVSVHKEQEDSSFLIGELIKGDIFGELGLFMPGHKRSTRITCREQVKLAEIKYSDFNEYIKKDITPIIYLYNMLSKRLEDTTNRTESIVTQDVIHRVWNLLVDLSSKEQAVTHPEGSMIRISRKEIGQMIGCSREMSGKAISELTKLGKITSSGKTIVVLHAGISCTEEFKLGSKP